MTKLPLLSYPFLPLALPLFRTRDPDASGLASAACAARERAADRPDAGGSAGAPCPMDSPDAGGLAGAPCPVREGRADGPAAGVAGAPSTAR